MRGRGTAIVFVPNFGCKLIERLGRHVAVLLLQVERPDDELMALLRRRVRFWRDDREMAPDIAAAKALVVGGALRRVLAAPLLK